MNRGIYFNIKFLLKLEFVKFARVISFNCGFGCVKVHRKLDNTQR